ncbi:MAG: hypothetical protein WCV88_04650 [Patescibacteria group bacterium]|jgi:hypothetical protein
MDTVKKANNQDLSEKKIIFKAVERSAQIEGLSLQRARSNLKVIIELQKHGRAFAL